MCVLQIFYGCPGDIKLMFWIYLLGVLDILICVLKIFDGFIEDI